jgi:flagellar biosynthesis/type III secretory pathway M-ring protein FliF/YscJ
MAALQETIAKATRHLGDMTLSQRLAIGLGALLVVGSLVWLAQWAATPETVPLLPGQSLEPEEVAAVRAGLDALDEPYRIEGSEVMVRATANRQAILASLQQAERLPTDTSIGFGNLLKDANPWISQEENSRRWTVALQSELARVLQEFTGIRQARVLLNLNAKPRGFARSHPESSAGVTLSMKGGEPVPRSLALAAARLVAGAVRGLPVKNVQVIDGGNGRVALDWDGEESGSASSVHQQRKQLEREKELQIKEQLSFDPHVLVSVSAEVEYSTLQEQDSTPIEGVPVKEETDATSTVRGRRAEQPGVEPNVGVSADAGGGTDTSTSDRTETVYQPGQSTRTVQTPAGVPKSITAAVSLSYSYLARVYGLNNPDAETPPSEAQIEEVFKKQKDQVITQIAKLVIPPKPEQVSVVWHHDTLAPEPTVVSGTLDTSLNLVQRYGPASALGVLAFIALGLMMRLAKQRDGGESFGLEIGLPKEAIEAAKRAAQDLKSATRRPAGGGTGGLTAAAGQFDPAEEGAKAIPLPVGQGVDGVLDAQEVPQWEEQIRQMLAQVSQMTERDAQSVATLVENWVEHGR